MYVPMNPGPTAPRGGDLPRIGTYPSRPTSGYGYRNPYGNGAGTYGNGAADDDRDRGGRYDGGDRGRRYARRPYTTGYTPGSTTGYTPIGGYPHRVPVCGSGCVRIGGGRRAARVFSTFSIGYPFYVPILVPYIYDATYVRYGEAARPAFHGAAFSARTKTSASTGVGIMIVSPAAFSVSISRATRSAHCVSGWPVDCIIGGGVRSLST